MAACPLSAVPLPPAPRPPQESKKLAYLIDLQTVRIQDLLAPITASLATVNHDTRIDWLVRNEDGHLPCHQPAAAIHLHMRCEGLVYIGTCWRAKPEPSVHAAHVLHGPWQFSQLYHVDGGVKRAVGRALSGCAFGGDPAQPAARVCLHTLTLCPLLHAYL